MPYLIKRRISAKKDRTEANERRNSKWNKYYCNKAWKRLRNWQIENHPLCYDCMFEGRSVPATEVHHIVPFSTGATTEDKLRLLLDPDNVVSLCSMHHDIRHKYMRNENDGTRETDQRSQT